VCLQEDGQLAASDHVSVLDSVEERLAVCSDDLMPLRVQAQVRARAHTHTHLHARTPA